MKRLSILLFCVLTALPVFAVDTAAIASLPILHEGRMKPLDTFARTELLALSGRRSLPDQSALDWLSELLFKPQQAEAREVFRIYHPDVLAMLGVAARKSKRYSHAELTVGMMGLHKTIISLHSMQEEQRSPAQQQLVELFFHWARYRELSRSLSMFLPSEAASDHDIVQLAHHDGQSRLLRILPPSDPAQDEWLSPWEHVLSGHDHIASAAYLRIWADLAAAYRADDATAWSGHAQLLYDAAQQFTPASVQWRIDLEQRYNRYDLFTWSYALYVFAFLALAFSWLAARKTALRIAGAAVGISLLAHFIGLLMRMFIMARPPVTTLYESIIFVALIAVLFGFVLERVRRDGLGVLVATVCGAALHAIARGYADDGDTMGQLVAVLNTNFWLATHVVTITIGYGCALVGGIVAHVYLVQRIVQPDNKQLADNLAKNMLGIALFALFFTLFGTILGGIWADQSWGRFWGWDPKENGALWIVLWLLWLLHGRIAGLVKPLGFALGMIGTNIIVALAWFGVNLLNIGLHSYGFTDSIATNLLIFCSAELLFALIAGLLIRARA